MAKYKIQWAKTYVRSGEIIVEAPTEEIAKEIAESNIGDLDGRLQYESDKDYIDVYEEADKDDEADYTMEDR